VSGVRDSVLVSPSVVQWPMKNVYSFCHSATVDKITMLSQNMGHQSPCNMVPYPRTMEVLVFMWDIPVCGEYKLVQLIVNHTQ